MGNQEIIIDYIKRYIGNTQGSNSAILIKGAWGCGKTYFVKNVLNIRMKDFLQEQDKRLYYISLNGISSNIEIVKRIQTVIINEKMGFYKHKSKSEAGMMEIVTGVDTLIDDIKIQGWLNIALGAKKKIKKMISDKSMNSAVFIFDDLERCTMSLKEVFGMINDLIEHKKCKCIIIANEEEISEKIEYYKIKEKFISRTLEFVPNLDMFLKIVRNDYTYMKQIDDEYWEAFINEYIDSFDINLRIVQSAFFIANEVFRISLSVIKRESEPLIQKVLNKLLINIYEVERYCKEGHERIENKYDDKIINVYSLGPNDTYSSYREIFTFVFDIVYDGIYNEKTISNHIETYMQYLKTEGDESPIVNLKEYYYMEDDNIQENLDRVCLEVKTMNIKQASDLFNFLIPLLDLGFEYNKCSDFSKVIETILNTVEFKSGEDDYSYEVFGVHTTLKDTQYDKYVNAMKAVKRKIDKETLRIYEKVNDLINTDNWLINLQNDLKVNEYNYRKNQQYLAYFDIDTLLNKIEKSTNMQLAKFRNLLYFLYRRVNCTKEFCKDIETANIFVEKLQSLTVDHKINRLTINYIIGDLKESFPSDY